MTWETHICKMLILPMLIYMFKFQAFFKNREINFVQQPWNSQKCVEKDNRVGGTLFLMFRLHVATATTRRGSDRGMMGRAGHVCQL